MNNSQMIKKIYEWVLIQESIKNEISYDEFKGKLAESIAILKLSTRPSNVLHKENIKNIGQLINLGMNGVRILPGMGRNSINEIKTSLYQHGLSLNSKIVNRPAHHINEIANI